MRVVLEIHLGSSAGRKTWLRSGQRIVIGRTEGAECVIASDGQISSRHFSVECGSDQCLIRDLGSSNGTFLNGQKVEEGVIQNGDKIVAGQTTFAVLIEDAPRSVSAVTPSAEHFAPSPALSSTTVGASASSATSAPPASHKSVISPPKGTPKIAVPKPFDAGVADADLVVRREALFAAAWTRQRWLLEHCRALALSPSLENWDALRLFVILGKPSDLQAVLNIARQAALGPGRFQFLASFGHPEVIEPLLKIMRGSDSEDAVAAAAAFTKVTGAEIEREPASPSAAERAGEHWKKVRAQFAGGSRWHRGMDVSQALSEEFLEQIDLEYRCEACLRGNYEGTWIGSLRDLEGFP